ncbi:MAG: type I methionyl aminopeptidase, partial [Bdellovibrionales bacterium]|nr:type I methionyl aminopeptidase [Bdellovibrionales bacterium]
CLAAMGAMVKEGVTPLEIDRACYEWTTARGAVPAPLNYRGYPASLCVSVNDVVCHGIPNRRAFQRGDIVNLDVTPILNGFHGDTSATFIVGGAADDKVDAFVRTARESLWVGIRQVKPGNTLGDVGHAIQSLVEARGYSVVLDFCGHGIGRVFHEDPIVMHVGRPGHGAPLKPGMIFTIEPMINMGSHKVRVEKDGWTARTVDGSLSAQFEHTVLVTATGAEVLTLAPGEAPPPLP